MVEPVLSEENHLITILSTNERAELALLIVNIIALMRSQLSDVFEFPETRNKNVQRLKELTRNESQNEEAEESKEDSAVLCERKPSISKLDLERYALQFFDTWRDSVISRVNVAVKVPEDITGHEAGNISNKGSSKISDLDQNFETKIIKPESNNVEIDTALIELYPPVSTTLCSLPEVKRLYLLQALLLILLSLKKYTAHSRILLLYLTSSLDLPLRVLVEKEVELAQILLKEAVHMSGSEEAEKRRRESRLSHGWKVGLAGVAGAAMIGITGGLAAPLVASAVGTIMGGLGLGATAISGILGTLTQSSVVIGSLFGAYGARMTGKAVDSYAKEVNDFSFIPLKFSEEQENSLEDRRLRVTIGVSGWLTQEKDLISSWYVLGRESEVFALRWELEELKKLGTSMESTVKSAAWKVAKKEIIARTIFSSLLTALWPVSLLKISKVLDNPFSICMNRADKAGIILADAIINRAQGERPVSLIGYSLGARLIYSCLMSLAERRIFGLIESVVLMGTPIASTEAVWRSMRSVVSGRLVNVYSTNDYILAFLYRTWSVQYGVAGIQEIINVARVENVDVSEIVNGHLTYQHAVGSILEYIGWENVDVGEVSKEKQKLALLEQKNDENTGIENNIVSENDNEVGKLEDEVIQKMAAM